MKKLFLFCLMLCVAMAVQEQAAKQAKRDAKGKKFDKNKKCLA